MLSSLLRLGKKPTPAKTQKKPAGDPPLTAIERTANLTELERELNRSMKCQAGMNQVFIRSLVTLNGAGPPRIALKCQLRRDIGQTPVIFYEQIQALCCGDPQQCEAYQKFKGRFVRT